MNLKFFHSTITDNNFQNIHNLRKPFNKFLKIKSTLQKDRQIEEEGVKKYIIKSKSKVKYDCRY